MHTTQLQNQELHNLCFSTNFTDFTTLIMIRACSTHRQIRKVYSILAGNVKDEDHLEDRGADGKILLKWIFKKWNWVAWTGLI